MSGSVRDRTSRIGSLIARARGVGGFSMVIPPQEVANVLGRSPASISMYGEPIREAQRDARAR